MLNVARFRLGWSRCSPLNAALSLVCRCKEISMKFYYLLFFILISNGVHGECRIRILIDELARIHYEQHDANVVEREIENINSLSKIDEALSQSDIDGARKLVLLEMAKSAYKISEYSKNLSVKNGKNEASYTLGLRCFSRQLSSFA